MLKSCFLNESFWLRIVFARPVKIAPFRVITIFVQLTACLRVLPVQYDVMISRAT
ncbi:hypothetical protein P4V43_28935 [Brevibacillus fortis]|uniref:hypothetical protein n=1 Tax=Brevibacillus fortis TaxID=2126352 RepID=UPI002E23FF0C|nr:hypothetical protein [Brevibacillus fortis]